MHDFSSDFRILSPNIYISQEWTCQIPQFPDHENNNLFLSVFGMYLMFRFILFFLTHINPKFNLFMLRYVWDVSDVPYFFLFHNPKFNLFMLRYVWDVFEVLFYIIFLFVTQSVICLYEGM